jgi:hypothetical protein
MADDYFEISDFEDPGRFFWTRHPRPLELVLVPPYNELTEILNNTQQKCARDLGDAEIR